MFLTSQDSTGLWDFKDLAEALPPKPLQPMSAQFVKLDNPGFAGASDLVRSFVRIACEMPLKIDGYPLPRKVITNDGRIRANQNLS